MIMMDPKDRVYQDVASTLIHDITLMISKYEDDLADKMAADVRGYDPSLCAYATGDPNTFDFRAWNRDREFAIMDLVEAELTLLFANE